MLPSAALAKVLMRLERMTESEKVWLFYCSKSDWNMIRYDRNCGRRPGTRSGYSLTPPAASLKIDLGGLCVMLALGTHCGLGGGMAGPALCG